MPSEVGAPAHQAAEDVLDPCSERDDGLDVRGRAGTQGASDLDGRTRLTALREGDGVSAALVREGLPSRTLGGIERARAGALARLLAQVGIRDARVRDELHQLESELVGKELVMRQTRLPTPTGSRSSPGWPIRPRSRSDRARSRIPLPKTAPAPDPGPTSQSERSGLSPAVRSRASPRYLLRRVPGSTDRRWPPGSAPLVWLRGAPRRRERPGETSG